MVGLTCLRCSTNFDLENKIVDQGIGCPACLEEGFPASLKVIYHGPLVFHSTHPGRGLRAYTAQLPYVDYPDLGEGGTPLIDLPELALSLVIEKLWVKNEGQNPTGSHKDRMSPLVLAHTLALGRETVVAASSGNAGASLAAYARRAGLSCVIISTPGISPIWSRAIILTGANLVFQDTAKDRWVYMKRMVQEAGWYPVTNYLDPPVGSNPFGVQGYKTIAYEIVETCGETPPTLLIVPTARGDLLWGIWEGLDEMVQAGRLQRHPRLVAVEPFPRLAKVLKGADYRQSSAGEPHEMVSIGGATTTLQSLLALRGSGGTAVDVNTRAAKKAQKVLGSIGLFVELSAAAALAGLWAALERKEVQASDRVALVLTSHGYKEHLTEGGS